MDLILAVIYAIISYRNEGVNLLKITLRTCKKMTHKEKNDKAVEAGNILVGFDIDLDFIKDTFLPEQ